MKTEFFTSRTDLESQEPVLENSIKPTRKKRFNTTTDLFYPDWVTEQLFSISRNQFDKIQLERRLLYFEDVDLCVLLRMKVAAN
jgi:GT2 family glycosyltransferase